MALNKNDALAMRHYSEEAYAAIPKSAFAILAWHLANCLSDNCDSDGAAEARIIEEANALALNSLLPEAHAKAIAKVLASEAARYSIED